MCGLFGAYTSRLDNNELENVQFLGLLATTRGIDSSGLAVFGRGKKNKITLRTHRKVDDWLSAMKDKNFKTAINIDNRFCIMGHTRWATLGAINMRNAHPIEEGGIVLCHNGSVDHFCKDAKSETDSDSREIARRLGRGNLSQTIKEIGNGHFAMTYVDLVRGTFNMVRNGYRPLAYMYNSADTTLYWASLPWMLEALKFKEGPSRFGEVHILPVDENHQFKLGTMEFRKVPIEQKKPVIIHSEAPKKPNEAFKITPLFCRKCSKRNIFCSCDNDRLDTSGSGLMRSEDLITAAVKNVSVPLLPAPAEPRLHSYSGYKGTILSVGAVLPVLKKGCACCTAQGLVIQTTKWFAPDKFICQKCYDSDPVVKEHLVKEIPIYDGFLLKNGQKWERGAST